MVKRVAILPGFAEGKWHTQHVSRVLDDSFQHVHVKHGADIVITHSAGIHLLPENIQMELLFITGLPVIKRRTIAVRLGKKVRRDYKRYKNYKRQREWWLKSGYNIVYFVRYPNRWLRMVRSLNPQSWPDFQAKQIVVIANEEDVFNSPQSLLKLAKQYGWKFYTLPGQHDDIWERPDKYVTIIKECL
jgi:hypothetical protein